MQTNTFTGTLGNLIAKAKNGTPADIDYILQHLTCESSLAMTRYIDYAISLVEHPEGIDRLTYYLFNGTLIQRNYCSLYFNRRGDWQLVKNAYHKGLIDEIQAFAR